MEVTEVRRQANAKRMSLCLKKMLDLHNFFMHFR
jgi:hypothetical protein